eukprot:CAMPEP_0116012694 /NCGR_PEP_ID=MMETSP0321-20121206/5268_1 /TAXON_ID=163516 /ORGANISM="Leptocylindrus danicus var. danicus, Strain B650" /LENGTH=142 /DNA_ID=CAMNT_0003482071 /DNA_START=180 /DNA_END=608 /DNA_ORIENTATION=-
MAIHASIPQYNDEDDASTLALDVLQTLEQSHVELVQLLRLRDTMGEYYTFLSAIEFEHYEIVPTIAPSIVAVASSNPTQIPTQSSPVITIDVVVVGSDDDGNALATDGKAALTSSAGRGMCCLSFVVTTVLLLLSSFGMVAI